MSRCCPAHPTGIGWSNTYPAKIFNVLAFALIGTVLAPRLAEIAWPQIR